MLTMSRSFKHQKLESLSQSSDIESQIMMQEQPLSQRLRVNTRFTAQPTRKHKIVDGLLLKPEMLSAGSDPLAKDQTFSRLANNPQSMMNTLYNKPPFARIRFPPILDAYSRTLANPICT